MRNASIGFVLMIALTLVGCNSVDDVSQKIKLGKEVAQNEAILEAGKEVITGSKELVSGGKDLIVQGSETIGDGTAKILSNGKIILDESQEIFNALEVENKVQPAIGTAVQIQEDTEGCGGDVACYLWRANADDPWKSLQGQIANLDEFSGQVKDLQVIFSGVDEVLGLWNVASVVPNQE